MGGDFPQDYLDLFIKRGIDISSIEIIKEGKTFFWSGRYHNDMNTRDTLVTELNVLENFQPIVPESYKDAKVLVVRKLTPDCPIECFGSNDRCFDIGYFRYHEFLDGSCIE